MIPYNPANHYWLVGGDPERVWSSQRVAFVPGSDDAYQVWRTAGGVPTSIDSVASIEGVLRAANVPPYHLVPKRVIVDRLHAAGLLDAARAALDAVDLYTRERWNNRDSIYASDPTARALIGSIGGNPDAILAPDA